MTRGGARKSCIGVMRRAARCERARSEKERARAHVEEAAGHALATAESRPRRLWQWRRASESTAAEKEQRYHVEQRDRLQLLKYATILWLWDDGSHSHTKRGRSGATARRPAGRASANATSSSCASSEVMGEVARG